MSASATLLTPVDLTGCELRPLQALSTQPWTRPVSFSIRSKARSIVNLASMYGMLSPQPDTYTCHPQFHDPLAHGAAKTGVIEFTRYAACHRAKQRIRVHSVSPGPFPTSEVARDRAFVAEPEQRVPTERIGEAAELAGPAVFLLSSMSSFVTGHNRVVDGGWTAW